MKATAATPTAPQVSASDVARSFCKFFALCIMYILQCLAKAFCMALRAAFYICQWLNDRHNITDQEDPVMMTGWQCLGCGAFVLFAAVVICIKW